MTIGAPTLGWGILLGAALAASLLSLPAQIGFAVLAIGVVGMAHGAGDLAVVEPRQRPLFLTLYAAACATCLWWWIAEPAIALPLFLLASAIHFGVEDAPADAPIERALRGVGLVTMPAVFHHADLRLLLDLAGGQSTAAAELVGIMVAAGAIAGGGLLLLALRRSDRRLLAGTAILLLLPPLVGFSVGFLMLHAFPQTAARQRQTGFRDMTAYLRHVAPLLAGAVILVGVIAAMVLRQEVSGVRSLFAAVAALAIPHLLVTPLFEARSPMAARLQLPCA